MIEHENESERSLTRAYIRVCYSDKSQGILGCQLLVCERQVRTKTEEVFAIKDEVGTANYKVDGRLIDLSRNVYG